MAPPARARPGYSRRAQYGIFAGYVTAVLGIVGGLVLALTARFDPQGHAALQLMLSDATSPISLTGRRLLDSVSSFYAGTAAYIDAGSKNRELEAEVRRLQGQVLDASALAQENARLKALTRLVEEGRHTVATARLVSSTGASARRYATLSAGSRQGVENGQPVRSPEGLIGRVVAVGRISARVLLIVDSGNVVPVMRLSDGLPALAVGRGDGTLDLRAVQAPGNPFAVGDVFVTSGAGGLYPPGMPVATVRVKTSDAAIARPLADPARFDFALVEPSYLPPTSDLPPEPETP